MRKPDFTAPVGLLGQSLDWLLNIDLRWAAVLFRVAGWWILAFGTLIVGALAIAGMRGMLTAIPVGIQVACLALIVLTIVFLVSMLRERRRVISACEHYLEVFGAVKPATAVERMQGLSPDKLKDVQRRAKALRGRTLEWWQAIEQSFELYTNIDGREGWFVTRPVDDCLPEDQVTRDYHAAFHESVPGMLTALGLLATFIAILVALAGVSYNAQDPTRPVTGIAQLINGLSGKFLSSIVALVLSVLFTIVEKKVCARQLASSYRQVLRRSRELFPFLSQARILLDIQRLAVHSAAIEPIAAKSPIE